MRALRGPRRCGPEGVGPRTQKNGAPKGGAPKFWRGPAGGGAPKGGAPRKVGGPKISSFSFPLPPHNLLSFFPLLGVFSWNVVLVRAVLGRTVLGREGGTKAKHFYANFFQPDGEL